MHIPSKRVYQEMLSEHASLWFVPTTGDHSHVMLLKCPANVLKSIIVGSSVTLIFGKKVIEQKLYLMWAIKIADDPIAPFIVSGVLRVQEEIEALIEILHHNPHPFYLFDELNRCVSWAYCKIEKENQNHILDFIEQGKNLYSGPFDIKASHALDCLDLTIDQARSFENAEVVSTIECELHFDTFQHLKIYAIGDNETVDFELGQIDEGKGFEQSTWHSLENLFKKNIYKSPNVFKGGDYRELTDVLCFSHDELFIFETKSIAILSTDPSRNTERRVKNIQKQIKKAMNQLCGALTSIREENKITSTSGEVLLVPKGIFPHAIILISELLPFGDWTETTFNIIERSKEMNAMFHVLDLQELSLLVRVSKSIDALDANLVNRFKELTKHRNIFIRGIVPPA